MVKEVFFFTEMGYTAYSQEKAAPSRGTQVCHSSLGLVRPAGLRGAWPGPHGSVTPGGSPVSGASILG